MEGNPMSDPTPDVDLLDPIPDVVLLDRVVARIVAHPEELKQGTYRCATGKCVAGHTAEECGGVWVTEANHPWSFALKAEADDPDRDVMRGTDYGDVVTAWRRARRLLGLTVHEAERLFAGHNTLDDIRRIVADIKRRATA
jgi:hypothetical protein